MSKSTKLKFHLLNIIKKKKTSWVNSNKSRTNKYFDHLIIVKNIFLSDFENEKDDFIILESLSNMS